MLSLEERRGPHVAALGSMAPTGEAGAGAEDAASLRGADAAAESLFESACRVGGNPNCRLLERWASSAWRAWVASARKQQTASRLCSRTVARDAPTGVREQLTASLARFASGGDSPSVACFGSSRDAAEIEPT